MWRFIKKTKSAVVICLVASLCFILFAPAASAEDIYEPRYLSADDTPWGEGRGNTYRAPSANILFETIWIVTDIIISGHPQQGNVKSEKAINRPDSQDADENETLRKVE